VFIAFEKNTGIKCVAVSGSIKYYGVNNSIDKGGIADAQDAILQNGWQQNYSIAGSGR
jgi:hypothetical protein